MTVLTKIATASDPNNKSLNGKQYEKVPLRPPVPPQSPPPLHFAVHGEGGWWPSRRIRLMWPWVRPIYGILGAISTAVLIVWILLALLLAGTLLYQQMRRPVTYSGWCSTNFVLRGHVERLKQSLEINPDQLYERISVPGIATSLPAVFVHDFKRNLTAIVDVMSNRCFIKHLDRNLIAAPKKLIGLIDKMQHAHSRNMVHVQHTYHITGRSNNDQLANLQSSIISHHCADRIMFWLSEASRSNFERRKRDHRELLEFLVLGGEAIEVDNIIL